MPKTVACSFRSQEVSCQKQETDNTFNKWAFQNTSRNLVMSHPHQNTRINWSNPEYLECLLLVSGCQKELFKCLLQSTFITERRHHNSFWESKSQEKINQNIKTVIIIFLYLSFNNRKYIIQEKNVQSCTEVDTRGVL